MREESTYVLRSSIYCQMNAAVVVVGRQVKRVDGNAVVQAVHALQRDPLRVQGDSVNLNAYADDQPGEMTRE